jgi:hypothetical protein
MPFTIVSQGTFTQPAGGAVNQYIPVPSGADYFTTTNLTQMATTEATGVNVRGEWYGGGLSNTADGISWVKTNSSNAINISTFATLGATGFTYYTSYPSPGPAVTGTAITQASAAVVSMTNTFTNGARVVLYNTTGMLQISGMPFTISSVSGSGFTLLGLNSSGFAAPATAVTARLLAPYGLVEPRTYYVTGVTQATNGVVTLSEAHNLQVGQLIEFSVPGSFGMVQLNNFYQPQSKPVEIIATTTYTITLNISTSNYTAFAFPASTGSPTTQLFAIVAPAGQLTQYNPYANPPTQTGYNFLQVPFRNGFFLPTMYIPSGAQNPGGSAGDIIVWQCHKMETGTINSPVPS